jgi:hypothetical protein
MILAEYYTFRITNLPNEDSNFESIFNYFFIEKTEMDSAILNPSYIDPITSFEINNDTTFNFEFIEEGGPSTIYFDMNLTGDHGGPVGFYIPSLDALPENRALNLGIYSATDGSFDIQTGNPTLYVGKITVTDAPDSPRPPLLLDPITDVPYEDVGGIWTPSFDIEVKGGGRYSNKIITVGALGEIYIKEI